MKDTDYYKSGVHIKNAARARLKAVDANKKLKLQRISQYNINPTKCKNCNAALPYSKRKNKFCNNSCAASLNNIGRVQSNKQKKVAAETLKCTRKKNGGNNRNYCKLYSKICKICKNEFLVGYRRKQVKTCCKKCATIASVKIRAYPNGRIKRTWFFNPYENKKVLLESSWEVKIANLLIKKDIEWIRPAPIEWTDNNNVEHLYFPDFYLTDYNAYLDPKNPYCMKKDKEKMEKVSTKIKVIFGDIELVKKFILSLAESGTASHLANIF